MAGVNITKQTSWKEKKFNLVLKNVQRIIRQIL